MLCYGIIPEEDIYVFSLSSPKSLQPTIKVREFIEEVEV